MGSKDKGGREAKKPKKDAKKSKPVITSAVIPPSTHASDKGSAGTSSS
jgi:hypothetical protein